MVKSSDDGSQTIAPFLKKCYEMVDDESTDSIICWSQSKDSFVIRDMTEFSVQLLPKYFKHNNFSSFIRQLNIYGFRKIDTDRWVFANENFIRGQKRLLKNICRRKHSPGDNQKSLQQLDNSIEPCENVESVGLWKEVENLKSDKNALTQELVKLRQHQELAHNKLLLLRDRLQGMEKHQQQMLSFLVMVMQSPGVLVQLLHSKENNWWMAERGRVVEQDADDSEPVTSDGMIIRYQPPMDEVPEPGHVSPMVSENPQESDPCSDGMKDFVVSPDFIKALMEENWCSFDKSAPFVLAELPNDSEWEQLLSVNPFSENDEDGKQDCDGPADGEMEMGTTMSGTQLDGTQNFDLLIEEMEKSQNLECKSVDRRPPLDKFQSLDMLTEQLGLLNSET
uniref:Heat stress transcription factor A-8 n=1 Tax=Rhizophora mucronata TaxID=61149 RepID=A0A2P2JGV8_RHIMU